MTCPDQIRRRLLLSSLVLPLLPSLQACTAPLATISDRAASPRAQALLLDSARAHGMVAFASIRDVNVRYEGKWRPIVGKLQPSLVDSGFRGGSEERLLPGSGMVAQSHTGPSGRKHVTRNTLAGAEGDVHVWFNGEEARDVASRAAAALVVDGYSLFLLGPLVLTGRWAAERSFTLEVAGVETIVLDGRRRECDVLRLRMKPGLGFSEADELALLIDRDDHLMRCVRFTLNGLESTRGAIAEVRTFDHVRLHGVNWPTRFYERLLRPLPLPVHDWRLVGLDVNRGLLPAELSGGEFGGRAATPATPLPATAVPGITGRDQTPTLY